MDKLRQRQELQAYRIARRNVIDIVNNIPLSSISKLTYDIVVKLSVKQSQIFEMYKEIYTVLVKPQYNRSKRQIKAELDFETIINNWLNNNAGLRIISVHQTLIETIINVIADGYENNLSVEEITRNLQKRFGWYKAQALRIARTETTTATNYATTLSAENSDFELEKTWISAQDNRTRRPPKSRFDHYDMNGQKVDANRPFFVGGEELQYPGDPKGALGNTINCRCKLVFTVKEDEFGLPIRKIK